MMDALPLPVVPAFELTIASQGMSKGLLQSSGAQFVPKVSLKRKQFQLGAQWKNITSNRAKGEGTVSLGWSGKAGGSDVGASLAYKFLTGATGAGDRAIWEMVGTVQRKFGKIGLKGTAVFSPDEFGATKDSLYVEGGPSYDLPWQIRASAAIGLRERAHNRDYTSFNAGLSRSIGKRFTIDVRYYGTDSGEHGETYRDRIVASVKLAL